MRLALIVFALSGCSNGSSPPDLGEAIDMSIPLPTIPSALALPESGQSLLLHAIGRGVQIYTCSSATSGDGGATYSYVFSAPDAMLLDAQMNVIGHHSAGPTWALTDGSNVVGMVLAKMAAPDPTAIPWLLLKVATNNGVGQLAHAKYVHRLHTQGGLAPTVGCDAGSVGAQARVDYSADYYFWGTM
jgi:hypothetical protein